MIGRSISQYTIRQKLGGGGMGVVYKAEDTKLGRYVAVKFLAEELTRDARAKRRFLQEARSAAGLDHPSICTVHEVGETEDGRLFIVMSCYEGGTVKERIAHGPLSVEDAISFALQTAEGLAHAHRAGVVHRDIKPANLLLTSEGLIKIVDFGLAKSEIEPHLSHTGTLVGTLVYMAPEQLQGGVADARSDLWSLGLVLYEMVTKRLPFRSRKGTALIQSMFKRDPKPVRRYNPAAPSGLQRILNRALARNPDKRYQTADEFAADLRALTQGRQPALATGGIAASHGPPSIAVLAFSDMSPGRDQEYFCDGIAEELIHALDKVEDLVVASRTSAFRFKGGNESIRTIGVELDVDTILEGSVRQAGNRVKVTANLVSVSDGLRLWSESFDRELDDIFAIQEEIAEMVTRRVAGGLGDDSQSSLQEAETVQLMRGRPANLEAYNRYLKGRYFWNKRTDESVKKSIALFQQAIDLDPTYARAHAGLSDAYATLGIYGAAPAAEVMPKAAAAARRALELDETLAAAHASMGCVRSVYDWDWRAGEDCFRTALALEPRTARAHQWYAVTNLAPQGRLEEAWDVAQTAVQLEPVSTVIGASAALIHYFARRYDEAVSEFRKVLDLDPSFPLGRFFLGRTFTEMARAEEAIEELEKAIEMSGGSSEMSAALACAYAAAGQDGPARDQLSILSRQAGDGYSSPSLIAQVHASLGDDDDALTLLERACDERTADLAWLAVRPVFERIRPHPRFQALLERMGLATG